jgi:hypothetical protein
MRGPGSSDNSFTNLILGSFVNSRAITEVRVVQQLAVIAAKHIELADWEGGAAQLSTTTAPKYRHARNPGVKEGLSSPLSGFARC